MTVLERLIKGEEATFNGYKIINVNDYSNITNDITCIHIVYLTNSSIDGSWKTKKEINEDSSNYIKFIPKRNINNLKQEDIITNINSDGRNDERKVLGIIGKAIALSEANDFNTADTIYTIKEIINFGYKLK